jgi:hypothetical protein
LLDPETEEQDKISRDNTCYCPFVLIPTHSTSLTHTLSSPSLIQGGWRPPHSPSRQTGDGRWHPPHSPSWRTVGNEELLPQAACSPHSPSRRSGPALPSGRNSEPAPRPPPPAHPADATHSRGSDASVACPTATRRRRGATGDGAGPPPMAAPSLSDIAPLLALSLYIQATPMTHAGCRRHMATAHDESGLRSYGDQLLVESITHFNNAICT